jgi:hypothetical protein
MTDLPPIWDQPVRYIDKTHAWYDALGYGNPYRYAQHRDAPFTQLARPLAETRVALLTTAALFQPDKGNQRAGAPTNAAAKFYRPYTLRSDGEHDLRVSHVAVDRHEMQDDPNCWYPLPALRRALAAGRIGAITPHIIGVPTNRSQRHTVTTDAPEILALLREDQAEAAILVPNCPICNQTMSLVSRHLEQAGIPTLVMGTAKDIVELCGVARFLFSDLPLGNAAGRPFDVASQDATLSLALTTLETAAAPRTTVANPLRWDDTASWKTRYLSLDGLTQAQIAEFRARNDQVKQVALSLRQETLAAF